MKTHWPAEVNQLLANPLFVCSFVVCLFCSQARAPWKDGHERRHLDTRYSAEEYAPHPGSDAPLQSTTITPSRQGDRAAAHHYGDGAFSPPEPHPRQPFTGLERRVHNSDTMEFVVANSHFDGSSSGSRPRDLGHQEEPLGSTPREIRLEQQLEALQKKVDALERKQGQDGVDERGRQRRSLLQDGQLQLEGNNPAVGKVTSPMGSPPMRSARELRRLQKQQRRLARQQKEQVVDTAGTEAAQVQTTVLQPRQRFSSRESAEAVQCGATEEDSQSAAVELGALRPLPVQARKVVHSQTPRRVIVENQSPAVIGGEVNVKQEEDDDVRFF